MSKFQQWIEMNENGKRLQARKFHVDYDDGISDATHVSLSLTQTYRVKT